MPNDNKTPSSRREMLSSAIMASTALTIGLLGISANAGAAGPAGSGAKADGNFPDWGAIRDKYFTKKPDGFNPRGVTVGAVANRIDDLAGLRQRLIDHVKSNNLPNIDRTAADDSFQSASIKRIESTLTDIDNFHKEALLLGGTFLPTHVDILLNQASDLLERAMSDRSKWDDMSIRNLMQSFDLRQFLDLDQIHLDETGHMLNKISNGIYDQDYNSVKNQYDVETLNNTSLTVAQQFYNDFIKNKWSPDIMNKIVADYLTAVQLDHNGNKDAATIATNYQEAFANSLANQFASNNIQNNSINLALAESSARLKLLESSLDWAQVNKDFQFKRTNVARKYQFLKLASNLDEDGVLNYNKRLEPLKGRFEDDLRNAYGRLLVCEEGLRIIFGYVSPLPDPLTARKVTFFDDCLSWVRKAVNFFNRFTRIDQTYVLPISLRNLIQKQTNTTYNLSDENANDSAGAWDRAIQSGIISVKIDDSLFPNQYHVRVKGVNAFLDLQPRRRHDEEVNKVNGYIIADIDAPPRGYYMHADGNSLPADQTRIPRLRMGRLGTRNFIRTPEMGGTSIFYNISPFGNWTISLPQITDPQPGSKLTDLVRINDVYLDLIVTVRMLRDPNK